MPTVTILGATGACGGALARGLAGRDGATLRLAARDAARGATLARELGAEWVAFDLDRPDTWAAAFDGADLVVDATGPHRGRDRATTRAALEAGAHWIDLAEDREFVLGAEELDALAQERGRFALSGAGALCGATTAFAQAAAARMARVNEVLVGVAPGDGAAVGLASYRQFLTGLGRPVRMLIGGDWTERAFWGDARTFEHPAPVGALRSFNVDAPDLEVHTRRPVRATSVRVSVGPAKFAQRRGMDLLRWMHRKGWVKDPVRLAPRVRGLARARGAPAALTVVVRGVGETRLPVEERTALIAPSFTELAVAPALVLTDRVLAGDPPESGAGPAVRGVSEEALLARLGDRVTVRRGGLGGWKA